VFYTVSHEEPRVKGRRQLPRSARSRRRVGPGRWRVRARLERFTEPAVLLVLRDSPGHGYELLEQLETLMPNERIDMGNLYRILRSLEREGLVASSWDDEAPGPAKRVYVITQSGRRVLAQWVEAFKKIEQQIAAFAKRYDEGRG
jgi:PadR family transcriptional regulator